MEGPLIAIIGSPWKRSADGVRVTGAEATLHEQRVRTACTELGAELANAGCRLLVYSAEEHSIEPDIVRGFTSAKRVKHAIEFRHPRGGGGTFPEQALTEETIYDRADPADDWAVSFYRSLKDADGALLLGGYNTVNISGQLAIAFQLPVATVADFGGAASEVWKDLNLTGDITAEEHAAMGQEWRSSLSKPIVQSLVRRHDKRAAARDAAEKELAHLRRREAARTAEWRLDLATSVAFVALVALLALNITTAAAGTWFAARFFTALVLGGVVGAGVRELRNATDERPAKVFLVGAIAGFMSSVLYLGPQLIGDKSLLSTTVLTGTIVWQILVATALSFTGGLAADTVIGAFKKRGEQSASSLVDGSLGVTGGAAWRNRGGSPGPRGRAAPKSARI